VPGRPALAELRATEATAPVTAPAAGPGTGSGTESAGGPVAGGRGYRAILRDRAFLRLCGLTTVLIAAGFSQFNTAMPVLVTGFAGLTARHLSVIFAANTVAVVAIQLVTLRIVAGRRRTRVIVLLSLLWTVCWGLVLLSGRPEAKSVVFGTFIITAVLFAAGETLLAPTLPTIANNLAPEALRGRYNGALTLAYTIGFIAGPLISGAALERGLTTALLVGLVGLCVAAAGLAIRLERVLPRQINRIPSAATPTGATAVEQPSAAVVLA
jgi:Major Facilitator Superfamily